MSSNDVAPGRYAVILIAGGIALALGLGAALAVSTKRASQDDAAFGAAEALEKKGDIEGACRAYERVLDRSKDAKRESTAASAARAKTRALGCGR